MLKSLRYWSVLSVLLAACGGSEPPGTGTAYQGGACTDGMMSGATCTTTQCSPGSSAIAVCSGAKWSACTCTANTASPPPPAAPTCGNGKKEGTELCDGIDLGGVANCAALNMGTGPLTCDATCKFVTLGCLKTTVPAGGTGAMAPAMGGTGAGTAGAGTP
jgi:hypothetical protein